MWSNMQRRFIIIAFLSAIGAAALAGGLAIAFNSGSVPSPTKSSPRPPVHQVSTRLIKAVLSPATHLIGKDLAVNDPSKWQSLPFKDKVMLKKELVGKEKEFLASESSLSQHPSHPSLKVSRLSLSGYHESTMPHLKLISEKISHPRPGDPVVTTTYGGYASPMNIVSPQSATTNVPCASGFGVTICSGVASSATPIVNTSAGEVTLSTAAFGIASAQASSWLGVVYNSQAPAHVSSTLSVTATAYVEDGVEGVSGIGVSCAPTYVYGEAFTQPVQTNQVASCLNTLSVSIPTVDATEADSEAEQLFAKAMGTFGNADTIEGWLGQLPSYNTVTMSWTGSATGGGQVLIAMDPQILAIDSGAGVEVHAANVIVQFQVQETYQGVQSVQAPPADAGVNYSQASYSTVMNLPGNIPAPLSNNWQLISGNMPTGLHMSVCSATPCLVLSGAPHPAGFYTFEIEVTDANNNVWPFLVHLTVHSGPRIVTNSFPPGEVGASYNLPITAVGGVPIGNLTPYLIGLAPGSAPLPPGLSFLGNTIQGIPKKAGSYYFMVQVQDAAGGVGTFPFDINVQPPLVNTTHAVLPGDDVGVRYDYSLGYSGGVGPYQWSLSDSGNEGLPPGLSLSPNGIIHGTPTQAGIYYFFPVVTDGLGVTAMPNPYYTPYGTSYSPVEIVVSPPPTIVTTSIANGEDGLPYRQVITVSGGTAPYSVTSWGLPTGLSIRTTEQSGGADLVISGTPNVNDWPNGSFDDDYSLDLYLTDSAGGTSGYTGSASASYNSWIIAPPLALSSSLPTNAQIGTPYQGTLCVEGGMSPFKLSVSSGSLPSGLAIKDVGTGCGKDGLGSEYLVEGVPTIAAVNSSFTITTTDSLRGEASVEGQITLPVAVAPTSLPNADVAVPYKVALAAGGSIGQDYYWTLQSAPSWLSLSISEGNSNTLKGTPPAAGDYSLQIKVSTELLVCTHPLNGIPTCTQHTVSSVTQSYHLTVISGPKIATATLPEAIIGSYYSDQLSLVPNGDTGPWKWSLSQGTLPTGLQLSTNGTIQGTPYASATNQQFTVEVTDAYGASSTAQLSLPVKLVILTNTLPTGTVGMNYQASLAAEGGTPPYVWSITNGNLPPGIELSSSGELSGTPSTAGNFTFTAQVEDSATVADTSTMQFSITVNSLVHHKPKPPSPSPIPLPPLPVKVISITPMPTVVSISPLEIDQTCTPLTVVLETTGGVAPYTWSINWQFNGGPFQSSLPSGWSNSESGNETTLSGPLNPGLYSGTITVSDSSGDSGSYPFTVTVLPYSCSQSGGGGGSGIGVGVPPGGGSAPSSSSGGGSTPPPTTLLSGVRLSYLSEKIRYL